MKINIPQPCHENWNAMIPEGNGRFCGSCEKVVVDFTAMSQQEIIAYFKNTQGQKVCGRFYDTQLSQGSTLPEVEVVYQYVNSPIHPFRKFLLALLLVFGLGLASCNSGGGDSCTSKNAVDSAQTITGVLLRPIPNPTMGEPMVEELTTPPEYQKGNAAIVPFLNKYIQYPDSAIQHSISGKVFVRCFISAKGTIDSVKVLKGIGYGCDEEAMRVIKKLTRWNPAMKGEHALPGTIIIPVQFTLK
jgi:TonB family protein